MRIGIFFCQVDEEKNLNIDTVAKYSANLPEVEMVRILGVKPSLNPMAICRELKENHIQRVVIAGDMPGFYKPVFTKAMALAGYNPHEVRLASFRAHGATDQDSNNRAKAIVACASRAVPYALAAIPKETPVNHSTLIIGSGIAGIQAALEIADADKPVYLVERSGTIGGHMAMFDKTFPTLDCAACILTPKMVSVGQHEMINLMTYSEVEAVTGVPGAYKVKIRQHARHVDIDACVACDICSEVCPVKVPSEFDANISDRKAIYIPFPQAVPNAYLVPCYRI